jgi:hypothetical protein
MPVYPINAFDVAYERLSCSIQKYIRRYFKKTDESLAVNRIREPILALDGPRSTWNSDIIEASTDIINPPSVAIPS